jgi:hypothetical protein
MNSPRLKVKDNLMLERDCNTNAIINTDNTAYTQMLNKINEHRQNVQRLNSIEDEIKNLKDSQCQLVDKLNTIISLLDK